MASLDFEKLKSSHESIRSLSSQATTVVSDQHPDIDLPIQFKIYCDKNRFCTSTWYLGTHKGGEYLKLVSCAQGWRSKLHFHDGPDPSAPVLASTVINNKSIDLSFPWGELHLTSPSRMAIMRTNIDFTVTWPSKHGSETFTWERSSGPEVKSLGGRGGGWLLVREATGEPVAAYSADYGHIKLSGRFKFMGAGVTGGFGKDWAVMVILTALSIGQRKRDINNQVVVTA